MTGKHGGSLVCPGGACFPVNEIPAVLVVELRSELCKKKEERKKKEIKKEMEKKVDTVY